MPKVGDLPALGAHLFDFLTRVTTARDGGGSSEYLNHGVNARGTTPNLLSRVRTALVTPPSSMQETLGGYESDVVP